MQKCEVYKSFFLSKSIYNLTKNEHQLFDLVLGRMNQTISINPSIDYRIPVEDYAERFNLTLEYAYKEIKEACSSLTKKTYIVKTRAFNPTAPIEHETEANWIDRITYNKAENLIMVKFTETTALLVSNLDKEKGFLKYNLENKHKLGNIYSIRFYELFKNWLVAGWVTYTIEDLKTWLMLEERYGLYGHFKANILLPAIEDINKNTDITVGVEKEFKEGRRVVKIKFVVKGGKIEKDRGFKGLA